MAQLIFFDQGHEYQVDGVRVPSVSEVLRFLSREAYDDINQYTLDNAAERGKMVHRYCENIDRYGAVEADDEYVEYVRGYVKFLREHSVLWNDIEKALCHHTAGYAGTIDRFGTVDGDHALVDIKTVSVVKKTLVKAQLNGYESMRRACGLQPADKLYCLQLLKDGGYRLYPIPIDGTEFEACLTLHHALITKQPHGRIA